MAYEINKDVIIKINELLKRAEWEKVKKIATDEIKHDNQLIFDWWKDYIDAIKADKTVDEVRFRTKLGELKAHRKALLDALEKIVERQIYAGLKIVEEEELEKMKESFKKEEISLQQQLKGYPKKPGEKLEGRQRWTLKWGIIPWRVKEKPISAAFWEGVEKRRKEEEIEREGRLKNWSERIRLKKERAKAELKKRIRYPTQCPKCGTINPEDAEFCGECGNRLHKIRRKVSATLGYGAITAAEKAKSVAEAAKKNAKLTVWIIVFVLGFWFFTMAIVPSLVIILWVFIGIIIVQIVFAAAGKPEYAGVISLVIIVVGFWFLTTPRGKSVGIQVNDKVYSIGNTKVMDVPLSYLPQQISCVFTEGIQMTTDPWNSCREIIGIKEKARELGCTDCFTLETKLERGTVKAGEEGMVGITINAKQIGYCPKTGNVCQPGEICTTGTCLAVPFAKKPVTSLTVDSLQPRLEGACAGNSCEELDPSNLPFTLTSYFNVTCNKTYYYPIAYLQYIYEAKGTAPVYIKPRAVSKPRVTWESETHPGPIRFDILPGGKTDRIFIVEFERTISITLTLRNEGSGTAQINEIILEQTPPLQLHNKPLSFLGCAGAITRNFTDSNQKRINISAYMVLKKQTAPSDSIICKFGVPDGITDFSTYSFTGSASYNYTLSSTVDTLRCLRDYTQIS